MSGYLLAQRLEPSLTVEEVSVETAATVPACGGTADIVGVVRTDGHAGTLAYHWLRSDGTTSGTLLETVTRGQRETRLHLLWTFRGRGRHEARAELRIDSPSGVSPAAVEFTYTCP
ncbi:hypothetical protein [Streptomyces marianii]|uniref:Ig-like domain-containing protein n=1 Tax=Streptomyces marianii TaxID=1817406 RepID=A0A5R9DZJ4_9ACTN|nr:hypothetical protein [Streptomyces marianii]TLQ42182.1 hypothetical protein FEF34_02070 [Streptomyces marianii]